MVLRKRLKLTGQALVFVTTTVKDWVPLFSESHYAREALMQFGECLKSYRVESVAYVLMPSHFHALLGFDQVERLSRFMQTFKSLTSRRLRPIITASLLDQFTNDSGRFGLWKPRFDDFIVTSEEQFRTKLNYIHTNPVRAELVESPGDYQYSSAADWLEDNPGPIQIDKNCSWIT